MNQCESSNESTITHPGIRCAGCFEHENSVKCEAEPHWTVLYQYVLGFPWSSDSTRWSMHSLKKNLLEWRWIWTISFGIMWSLANSFSINQLGLWWPISKSSWRIWILRGCRIQTQIDPQSSDESIVSINVWSFVTICGQHLSMFRGWNPFLLGIASSKNNSVLRTRLLS